MIFTSRPAICNKSEVILNDKMVQSSSRANSPTKTPNRISSPSSSAITVQDIAAGIQVDDSWADANSSSASPQTGLRVDTDSPSQVENDVDVGAYIKMPVQERLVDPSSSFFFFPLRFEFLFDLNMHRLYKNPSLRRERPASPTVSKAPSSLLNTSHSAYYTLGSPAERERERVRSVGGTFAQNLVRANQQGLCKTSLCAPPVISRPHSPVKTKVVSSVPSGATVTVTAVLPETKISSLVARLHEEGKQKDIRLKHSQYD